MKGLVMLVLAGAAFGADPLVEKGFEHFYSVEYPQAIASFEKAVAAKPGDANRHNYLAQGLLFSLMYRSGALESQLVTGADSFLRREKVEATAEEERRFFGEIQIGRASCRERV